MSNQHINIISAFTKIGSCIQLSHGPWNVGSTHSKACDICEFSMSSISLTVYRITNFVKIPVHWPPRLLLITEMVEVCSPWGCKALIALCQAIADHVAGQFPVASNQKRQYNKHISTLQLQSLDPGRILQLKNTHKKVKAPVWGGNFYGITKLEHLWIQNLISKKQLKLESEMRQCMSSSPQNLQTRGHHLSPFDQILGISIWKTSCAYQHQPLLLALTAEARNRRWKLFGAHHLGFQSLWPVFGAWKLFRKEGACGLRQKKQTTRLT